MFTQFSPGTIEQVIQIHRKSEAVDGKLYYGIDSNGVMHTYKGTHEGRLKEETDLVNNEVKADINIDDIDDSKELIDKNIEDITELEKNKADKCFVIAMSIVL